MSRRHSRTSSNESVSPAPSASKRTRRNPPPKPTSMETLQVNREKDDGAPERKRTRTGCQTCRIRHLKCDEARPECSQCVKGKRHCTYERLLKWPKDQPQTEKEMKNFQVSEIPYEVPIENPLSFEDESVKIASEYIGGEGWYAAHHRQREMENPSTDAAQSQSSVNANIGSHNIDPYITATPTLRQSTITDQPQTSISMAFHTPTQGASREASRHLSLTNSTKNSVQGASPRESEHQFPSRPLSYNPIEDPLDEYFMHVFIEEMGKWMDTMNPIKYFSNMLPYESTTQPILYYSFLACGAAHQYMVRPNQWSIDCPRNYYNKATTEFKEAFINVRDDDHPSKNATLAKSSVVLVVYLTLMGTTQERIEMLESSRYLIKLCRWKATSIGPEGACFWLQRGMELLTFLSFPKAIPFDQDEESDAQKLGLTFDHMIQRDTQRNMESLWTRKIICIVTKITNELLYTPAQGQDVQTRLRLWTELSRLMEGWDQSVPVTMLPLWKQPPGTRCYQADSQVTTSNFPRIYLPDRASVFARIFYHTGWILLAKTHPYGESSEEEQMRAKRLEHAKDICGIARHVEDRALASVMLRPCFMAAECLEGWDEQEEAHAMLTDFKHQTGWKIDPLLTKLKKTWGHPEPFQAAIHPEKAYTASTLSPDQPTSQHAPPIHNTIHQPAPQSFSSQQAQSAPGDFYHPNFDPNLPQAPPNVQQQHIHHTQRAPQQYDTHRSNMMQAPPGVRRPTMVAYEPQQAPYPNTVYPESAPGTYPAFTTPPSASLAHEPYINNIPAAGNPYPGHYSGNY
ncbi:hypothetical protein BT63DRAFT_192805 [Microthyrium microscopicum]|uniref:Zn(2)-C6 fungal-type domain-containing protein n=1 Tax=Microthyrium microscopicum TaxID=703497 RepID=A0A6A6UJ24_9PEZI|nr:hypothetical protein BT63DRAFT_192805 [Microthyrium microscopicum]